MAIHKRLFFLLLFLLPTQLGYHFWPEWSSVLGRRVDYLSPTVFITDLLVGSIFISWAVVSYPRIRRRTVFISVAAILLVAIFAAINSAGAINIPVSIYWWIKVLEYGGLYWYIVATKVKMRDAIYPLALSVGYSSVIGVAQFFLQHSLGGPFWFLGERSFFLDTPGIARFNVCPSFTHVCILVLRAYGTFPHPNILGGYIAVVSPVLISYVFLSRSSHVRLYIGIVGVSMVALLCTFSRSAWVVACIHFGIVLLSAVGIRAKRISIAVRVMSISIVCGLLIVSVMFFPSMSDESVVRRVELQQAAFRMWQHAPILGIGLGNFLSQLPFYTHSRYINFLQPVHNIFILLFVELGALGAFIIILATGFVLYRSMTLFSRATVEGRFIYIRSWMPMLCILILGSIDHYPVTLQQGQLLATIFSGLYISSFSDR